MTVTGGGVDPTVSITTAEEGNGFLLPWSRLFKRRQPAHVNKPSVRIAAAPCVARGGGKDPQILFSEVTLSPEPTPIQGSGVDPTVVILGPYRRSRKQREEEWLLWREAA